MVLLLHQRVSEAAECKSGSVISPRCSRRACQGCHPHPDVYIFLHLLSHPLPSFCLMNLRSVRPSISTLLLLFPPSFLLFLYHSWPIPVLLLWLRVGRSSLAAAVVVVVGGGGWAMVGLHVFKQTEIFMYVCLCRCVRATSRVPPPRPFYVRSVSVA